MISDKECMMIDDNQKKQAAERDAGPEAAEDSEHYHSVWEYGVNPSSRPASHEDMSDVRKAMIRFALEHHPIRDIRTYSGYKGDLLIQITTADHELLSTLKEHAESIGMQTAIKERHDIGIHEIYCISPDEEVYGIKQEEF
jgi:hypothetical protein